MEKLDSHRHSTGSFGENVGEVEQVIKIMFEVLSFCNWEGA